MTKKTFDVYMGGCECTEQALCDSCKHQNKQSNQEPCRSCVISCWEPMEGEV